MQYNSTVDYMYVSVYVLYHNCCLITITCSIKLQFHHDLSLITFSNMLETCLMNSLYSLVCTRMQFKLPCTHTHTIKVCTLGKDFDNVHCSSLYVPFAVHTVGYHCV